MRCLLVMVYLLLAGRGAVAEEGKDEEPSIEKLVEYLDAQVRAADAAGYIWPKLDDPKWKAIELSNEQVIEALGQRLHDSTWTDGFMNNALLSRLSHHLDLSEATDAQIDAILRHVLGLKPRPQARSRRVDKTQAYMDTVRFDREFDSALKEVERINAPSLAYRDKLSKLLPQGRAARLNFIIDDLNGRYVAGVAKGIAIAKVEDRLGEELRAFLETDEATRNMVEHYRARIQNIAKPRVVDTGYKYEGGKAVVAKGSVGLSEEKRDELLKLLDPKPSLLD